MVKYQQLNDLKDILGKTIDGFSQEYDEFYLKFTDDTFISLQFEEGDEGFGYGKSRGFKATTYVIDEADEILLKFGFVTKAEHIDAQRIQKQRWIDEDRIHKEKEEAMLKRIELDQLEKLKKKYEK